MSQPQVSDRPGLGRLAQAMATAVEDSGPARVGLGTLTAAAAAIDHSGPGTPAWRARIATAIRELVDAGLVEYPRTAARWDRRTRPELPLWVRRTSTAAPAPVATASRPWHHHLHWVPTVAAERRLSTAEQRLLDAVDQWLPEAGQARIVPLRERSWQLLGDDKALEQLRLGRLFGPDRLTLDLLRCRPTWPPVHQRHFGAGSAAWLIVENWSTFESLCTAASAGFDGRIIFGAGNQVGTRIAALAEEGDAPAATALYFGDVDPGGIRAARLAVTAARLAGWPDLRPSPRLYELALDSRHRLSGPVASADAIDWARLWFPPGLGGRIAHLLARGDVVRQEAVGLELLESVPFDALLDDAHGL